jgi:hypothetical protein
MDDLSPDLLAERPLLQYLRYNVQLDSSWLSEKLETRIADHDARELKAMDRPKNMSLLSEIGVKAAKRQIDDRHFPPDFDLGG